MEPRDLSTHVPYEAGRGIEETARELGMDPDELVKLSSNENAWGPSPKAVVALRESAATVHAYPKASHTDLTAALADRFSVEDDQVWLANGGDGALDYLARALLAPGDEVLVSDPGFAYYAMSARFHHGQVNKYPIRKADDFEQTAEGVVCRDTGFDPGKAETLGVPEGPKFGRLAAGETVTVNGREITPESVESDRIERFSVAWGGAETTAETTEIASDSRLTNGER